MYGIWYITICFGLTLLTVVAVMFTRSVIINYYYSKTTYYGERLKNERRGTWTTIEEDGDLVKSFKIEEEYKKINDRIRESHQKATDLETVAEDRFGLDVGLIIASLTLGIVFALISITFPLEAKRQANYFVSQKEYVEMAISNGEGVENLAITQEIIKQNEWLANAKASQLTFGCFSMYFGIDLNILEPITLPRK